jgi:hypothetical protein
VIFENKIKKHYDGRFETDASVNSVIKKNRVSL